MVIDLRGYESIRVISDGEVEWLIVAFNKNLFISVPLDPDGRKYRTIQVTREPGKPYIELGAV